jgi:MinD superfamily P-loop ATPase
LSRRVFFVVGAKGGVGATTIAIKLVQSFPALAERLIVDADLTGKRSLAVWYDLSDVLDAARVIGSVTVAPAENGTLVMELARTYEDGFNQSAATVSRAIAELSEHALIVVDAPQPFAATVRPFLNQATKIIVITESTVLGIAGARALLAAMDRFGIPAARIALAVSAISTGKPAYTRTEIERELNMPVSAELPNETDRRFAGLFDGFVTMLAAAKPAFVDPNQPAEKPAFDRRIEPGELFL